MVQTEYKNSRLNAILYDTCGHTEDGWYDYISDKCWEYSDHPYNSNIMNGDKITPIENELYDIFQVYLPNEMIEKILAYKTYQKPMINLWKEMMIKRYYFEPQSNQKQFWTGDYKNARVLKYESLTTAVFNNMDFGDILFKNHLSFCFKYNALDLVKEIYKFDKYISLRIRCSFFEKHIENNSQNEGGRILMNKLVKFVVKNCICLQEMTDEEKITYENKLMNVFDNDGIYYQLLFRTFMYNCYDRNKTFLSQIATINYKDVAKGYNKMSCSLAFKNTRYQFQNGFYSSLLEIPFEEYKYLSTYSLRKETKLLKENFNKEEIYEAMVSWGVKQEPTIPILQKYSVKKLLNIFMTEGMEIQRKPVRVIKKKVHKEILKKVNLINPIFNNLLYCKDCKIEELVEYGLCKECMVKRLTT